MRGGGASVVGDVCVRGTCVAGGMAGGVCGRGVVCVAVGEVQDRQPLTEAGGTHPTGMYSSF